MNGLGGGLSLERFEAWVFSKGKNFGCKYSGANVHRGRFSLIFYMPFF